VDSDQCRFCAARGSICETLGETSSCTRLEAQQWDGWMEYRENEERQAEENSATL